MDVSDGGWAGLIGLATGALGFLAKMVSDRIAANKELRLKAQEASTVELSAEGAERARLFTEYREQLASRNGEIQRLVADNELWRRRASTFDGVIRELQSAAVADKNAIAWLNRIVQDNQQTIAAFRELVARQAQEIDQQRRMSGTFRIQAPAPRLSQDTGPIDPAGPTGDISGPNKPPSTDPPRLTPIKGGGRGRR